MWGSCHIHLAAVVIVHRIRIALHKAAKVVRSLWNADVEFANQMLSADEAENIKRFSNPFHATLFEPASSIVRRQPRVTHGRTALMASMALVFVRMIFAINSPA